MIFALISLLAAQTPPSAAIGHARVQNVHVPAGGGVVDLGLLPIKIPTEQLVLVTATLGPNTQLAVSNPTAGPWIILESENASRKPVSFFDVATFINATYRAEIRAVDGAGPAELIDFELTLVPLATGTYDFFEPAVPTVGSSAMGWRPVVQLQPGKAGNPLMLLAGCAAQQQPLQEGMALRIHDDIITFPEGPASAGFLFFKSKKATVQPGFIAALDLPAFGANVALESLVFPPDGGSGGTGGAIASCRVARMAAVPAREPFASGGASNTPALGPQPDGTNAVLHATVVTGLTYVAFQHVYVRLDGGIQQIHYRITGLPDATDVFAATNAGDNLPATHVTIFTAASSMTDVEIAVPTGTTAWGATTLVMGPFDGGVIELAGPIDAGLPAVDAGTKDAGLPQPDAGMTIEAPRFGSDPPSEASCLREWTWKTGANAPLTLHGAPVGMVVESDVVRWSPRADDVGVFTFRVTAENALGQAEQKVRLELSPCRFEFGTCGCGAVPGAWLLLLIGWAVARAKRRPNRQSIRS